MGARAAGQTIEMGVGETIPDLAFSFERELRAGVTLTGTPTHTITPSGGPTLSNFQVNSAEVTINGKTVAAGKVVLFKAVGGGNAGVSYQVTITCATSNSGVFVGQGTLLQL